LPNFVRRHIDQGVVDTRSRRPSELKPEFRAATIHDCWNDVSETIFLVAAHGRMMSRQDRAAA
jgi:hypothetical protein